MEASLWLNGKSQNVAKGWLSIYCCWEAAVHTLDLSWKKMDVKLMMMMMNPIHSHHIIWNEPKRKFWAYTREFFINFQLQWWNWICFSKFLEVLLYICQMMFPRFFPEAFSHKMILSRHLLLQFGGDLSENRMFYCWTCNLEARGLTCWECRIISSAFKPTKLSYWK